MRNYLLTIFWLILIACQTKQSPKEDKIGRDTSSMEKDLMVGDFKLVSKLPDTTTIQGKIEYIKIQMQKEPLDICGEIEDTMFDVNYDGRKDLVLSYPMMHLGYETCVYDMNADSCFFKDYILWQLPNADFNIKSKKITSYYHGMGSGYGIRLQWMNGKWDTTMTYEAENQGDLSEWEIFYPKTGLKKKKVMSLGHEFPNNL